MIDDDELRLQLSHAAEEFPVRGWPPDMQRRVARRRRITAGFALASVVVAVVAIAVVLPLVTRSSPGPNGTMPPASTAGGGYVGSKWRLTSVAEGTHITTIPADVDAQIDLFSDGQFLASDGVNGLDGRFTKSTDGFEVYNVITSAVGYDGKDPHKLAAIAAIDTLANGAGYPRHWSSPARNTVVSVGRTQLIVQAGAFRLTFERAGPANDRN